MVRDCGGQMQDINETMETIHKWLLDEERKGFNKGIRKALDKAINLCNKQEKLFRSPESKFQFIILLKEELQ
jgi:hypothetical protein